jgi:23S rRNA (cytosine1962-C5)-methyltransferase
MQNSDKRPSLPRLRLQKGRLKRVLSGHPWVFSNELQSVPDLPPGSLVQVDDPAGERLGVGYFNPATLIAVRWLQRGSTELPEEWVEERVSAAAARRGALYPGEECVRLVYGEADGLPGVIADRYGDAVVLQLTTAGAELVRSRVESALRQACAARLLVRRDDSPMRELEGLPRAVEVLPPGAEPEVRVRFLGLSLQAPLAEGQKTGLFLDQRENVKAFAGRVVKGASVLDVFCYLGAWGLSALKSGAASCEFVDASLKACEHVEGSLKANGLPDCEIHNGDAFEVLASLRRAGKSFGAVIVDPPAFAKSKKHLAEAEKAYRRLNELAMALVEPGGILVSCSCSYHMGREEFREILRESAARSRREAVLLESRGQAPDHPVVLGFPEGEYLKAFFLRLR